MSECYFCKRQMIYNTCECRSYRVDENGKRIIAAPTKIKLADGKIIE